jgi:Tfp pilus assembly protein PilP
MRKGTASLIVCLLGAGCAAGQANQKTVHYAGDARGRASMEALPSLDVPENELTQEMRMARLLSAESLELTAPVAPPDRSAAQLSAWSDEELKDWLAEKQRRAEAARAELDRAAQQNHRQRIVAGALVGLVYEDIARALLTIPAPSELDTEPEVAVIFRELMTKQAAPFLVHAELAYAACAGNALGLDGMLHWSEFCERRGEGLPEHVPVGQELAQLPTARR